MLATDSTGPVSREVGLGLVSPDLPKIWGIWRASQAVVVLLK